MITFQPITEDLLEVLEILNSNSQYNILENGNPFRSIEEVRSEFLNRTSRGYYVGTSLSSYERGTEKK